MTQNSLPIRIIVHAAFAFVYLPAISLGFTSGLVGQDSANYTYVHNVKHFDGISGSFPAAITLVRFVYS